jgi:serpin B
MYKGKPVRVSALLAILFVLCLGASRNPAVGKTSLTPDPPHGNNAFALNLYRQLGTVEGNLFFSPYSIHTVLAMTYAGARGQTAAQMKTALVFPQDDAELHRTFADTKKALNFVAGCGYEMNIANSLWADKTHSFLQLFLDLNKKYYGAGLEQVDFINSADDARKKINTWVEKQTRQKIKDLIPPGGVNAETRLALVNAVYFKGRWSEAFEKKLTHAEPFYNPDGRTIKAPLMTFSKAKSLSFFAGDGIKLLELDYLGDTVSMVILLPDKADGLDAVEERLDAAQLDSWLSGMQKRPVRVHLPRFSMTWGAENITPHLRALGMQDAFVKGAADFSGIDGTRDLLISSVFHKAFVDVNEEGTEAAAATGVVVGVTSVPPPPEEFRADRPFLFLIREKKAGTILFMGRVTEPR